MGLLVEDVVAGIATRAGWLAESGLMVATGQVGIGWDVAGVVDASGLT